MTSKINGGGAAAGSANSREDGSVNLRRAREERAKAARADCEIERRWRLEIAAIFARRAEGAATVH